MKLIINVSILALLFALFCSIPVAAEVRMFDLQHRRAADVAEAVRTILGEGAKVTAIHQTLVVNASPQDLSVVSELLGRLDRPPRMLRVTVSQTSESSLLGTATGVSGKVSVRSSTVIAGDVDRQPAGGASLSLDGHGDHLRIDASTGMHRETRSNEHFIVTLEGYPARINVGRRIPFAEHWRVLAGRHHRHVESIRYEKVDTGFTVLPDVVGGDMVQLTIHPFLAFQDTRQPKEIQFQELDTAVNVPLGKWFDLGGILSAHDEISREIVAAGNGSGETAGLVRIKVELQPE